MLCGPPASPNAIRGVFVAGRAQQRGIRSEQPDLHNNYRTRWLGTGRRLKGSKPAFYPKHLRNCLVPAFRDRGSFFPPSCSLVKASPDQAFPLPGWIVLCGITSCSQTEGKNSPRESLPRPGAVLGACGQLRPWARSAQCWLSPGVHRARGQQLCSVVFPTLIRGLGDGASVAAALVPRWISPRSERPLCQGVVIYWRQGPSLSGTRATVRVLSAAAKSYLELII